MSIQDLILKYDIIEGTGARKGNLLIRRDKAAIKDGVVPEIKAKKADILTYFAQKREAAEQAARDRQAKIDAIPGLAEIQAAYADLNAWQAEFEASFDSQDGGGFGIRHKPQYDIDAMLAAHPQAAAYLKAKREANKHNYELSAIGKEALERVINGDYVQAIADMEAKIEAFTDRHFWD